MIFDIFFQLFHYETLKEQLCTFAEYFMYLNPAPGTLMISICYSHQQHVPNLTTGNVLWEEFFEKLSEIFKHLLSPTVPGNDLTIMEYSLQQFNEDMDLLVPVYNNYNNIFLWDGIDPVLLLSTEPKRDQHKPMALFQLTSKVASFNSTEKWFNGLDMIQVHYKRKNEQDHLPPHLRLPWSFGFPGYHEMDFVFVDDPFWN